MKFKLGLGILCLIGCATPGGTWTLVPPASYPPAMCPLCEGGLDLDQTQLSYNSNRTEKIVVVDWPCQNPACAYVALTTNRYTLKKP